MPVSHIGLTVSHLPASCSFFLSALQPLGYRFIGQQGNQIGLGISDADFFLCQETPGVKAGAAHIAFSAPSRAAVRDFYANALNAGGRPHGSPAVRNEENGYFNAAVLDFDGNSVEVVYRDGDDEQERGTVVENSRVLTWRKTVSESLNDQKSVVSARSSASRKLIEPAYTVAQSLAPSVTARSQAPGISRSASEPVIPVAQEKTASTGDDTAKKIIGTLIGAAAGAAVAYAMCKGEQESAREEAEAFAALQARRSQNETQRQIQAAPVQVAPSAYEQPRAQYQIAASAYEAPPKTVAHRNFSETDSYYTTPPQRRHSYRAIEGAGTKSYHSPSYQSVAPTQYPEQQQIEYVPASEVGARSNYSAHRSQSSPSTVRPAARSEAPRSEAGRSESRRSEAGRNEAYRSEAPRSEAKASSFVSTFVPEYASHHDDEDARSNTHRSGASSVHSRRSKKFHAPSQAPSRRASHPVYEEADEEIPRRSSSKAGSLISSIKSGSIIGSVLGRSAVDHAPAAEASGSNSERDNDADTVVPSDSISCAGSTRRSSRAPSTHSHRSRRDASPGAESSHSKHSRTSKHSKASKASKHSSSHRSAATARRDAEEEEEPPVRPPVIEEEDSRSQASTVRPYKGRERKDSAWDEQWVERKAGSVASLPVRGITPSMIEGRGGARTVVSYAMGQ